MIVMMIAITPSLNASKRPLVICASFIGVNAKSDENANALGQELIPCFSVGEPGLGNSARVVAASSEMAVITRNGSFCLWPRQLGPRTTDLPSDRMTEQSHQL